MSYSVLEALRNNPDYVKKVLTARRLDTSLVDKFLELDKKWRQLKKEVDELRHVYNQLSKEGAKAPPERRREIVEKARELAAKLENLEKEVEKIEREREDLLWSFPNLIHDSVPICPEGVDSIPVRYGGVVKVAKDAVGTLKDVEYVIVDKLPIGHADMAEVVLGMVDTLKAGEVAGSRFYYLLDDLVWLDFALAMYAMDRLAQKGFRPIIPPYMLKFDVIKRVLDFDTFRDAIYKIEGEDLYLIATAEHGIAAYLYKRELVEDELPLLFVGWSPCFRKEAGAGSRDLKGIFRVHIFHKVEQFVFSLPEDSWRWHEEITKNTEELIKDLGLPYRVVNICAHDLGAPAAKKYDIEVWYPAQSMYRELASCSNVTDWQSYRLGIRVTRKGMRREFVHTLNCTGLATTRTITAILENFQREDGVVEIPKVLRPYLEPIKAAPKDYIYPKKRS
ncbi:seryl-tRNA synthetase [Pyrobaculum islandicum DSM 4184]|uniref:Serine--tRNA ligase n=1 Tax=Pyrobaculum islandicum (strain DSM 4184 / JCM 9189 / GEO3) TaxID=384616 RepID=SYS_PYRIL|nr:serine--tRNA ligase [Pyrobaculum islandicum]A1RRX4.1 RecName: Full=Serine--tRNA ligase; AltName: Full=Seryl-tRNA synthetase; Short=SerRS; AltName: Full=Seryl-tRNA(Ser/Sec) synthetase [Pyrobaculum islandicum DSM 4184]ABL87706.1 seryl-tRNA synthetase [Pyrobaculum islandicum DSM 4184]